MVVVLLVLAGLCIHLSAQGVCKSGWRDAAGGVSVMVCDTCNPALYATGVKVLTVEKAGVHA